MHWKLLICTRCQVNEKWSFNVYSMESIVKMRTGRFYIFYGLVVDSMCIDTTHNKYCSIYQGNIEQQRVVSTLSRCRSHLGGGGICDACPLCISRFEENKKRISHFLIVFTSTCFVHVGCPSSSIVEPMTRWRPPSKRKALPLP